MRRGWPQLIVVFALSLASRAQAQDFSLGFSAGTALPVGAVADSLRPGLHLGMAADCILNPRLRLGGDLGFSGFSGRDVYGEDIGIAFSNVLVGAHVEFNVVRSETARLYARAGGGMYWIWGEAATMLILNLYSPTGGDVGMRLGWNAGLGFETGPRHGRLRYGLEAVLHRVRRSALDDTPFGYVQADARMTYTFLN